jgi:uncharacterized membrane protein YhhN
MSLLSWIFLGLAGVAAVADWFSVGTANKRLEFVAKPAVMVFLIGVVLTIDARSGSQQILFVVALAASLLGDVFLMLPKDRFILGLASFLLAHVAYTAGFLQRQQSKTALLIAAGALLVLDVGLLYPIVRSLSARGSSLVGPVIAYAIAISAMVATAFGTADYRAFLGATLFMFSDFLIARHRLVKPISWAPLAIIVTYHVGQAGIVLSLAS